MSSSESEGRHEPGCLECGTLNCYRREGEFPPFCPGEALDEAALGRALSEYGGDGTDARVAHAAAEVEGLFYGKLTRVEETVEFARRIGARKVGIATCVGLIGETRLFGRILKANGFEYRAALCKAGSVDKADIGIDEELKIRPGSFEGACNPLLQAQLLNGWKSDLNVVVGLCVGHDALFCKHSEAPATTLIVKDRVLGHNPAAALYTSASYYKRVMEERPK
ncbi:DUF1847 domain-containing protein [Pelodictyon luteolum]|uniref:DUF1847 domain-containing protein n=1 Tax=Chlorobium luteolum (strain DSM 273 / BCRC 81028 / 2530) TaxID=319225 RepID=Q3B1B8_CHLL3|nr:DUF1847 domain-containing protein [Pelodictyon luteolum]ABB24863.1 conserved hypothetical protein [Pelodictyon luteolum DSM 273]